MGEFNIFYSDPNVLKSWTPTRTKKNRICCTPVNSVKYVGSRCFILILCCLSTFKNQKKYNNYNTYKHIMHYFNIL